MYSIELLTDPYCTFLCPDLVTVKSLVKEEVMCVKMNVLDVSQCNIFNMCLDKPLRGCLYMCVKDVSNLFQG